MMNRGNFFTVLALSLATTVGGSFASANELVGNWVMKAGCVDQGDGTGLSLSATFNADLTFAITVAMFEDATFTGTPNPSVIDGTYSVGNASAVVPGAVDLDLSIAGQATQYTVYKYDAGVMQIGTTAMGTDDGTTPEKRHQALLGDPFLFVKQ